MTKVTTYGEEEENHAGKSYPTYLPSGEERDDHPNR